MLLDILTLCLLLSVSTGQTCPAYEAGSIGTTTQPRSPLANRVYINTDDTVPCAGTVYGWRFCTHPTSSSDAHVQVSLYHDVEQGVYELVNGSLHELTLTSSIQSYTCLDAFLDHTEYFSVIQGDMVASCWTSDTDRIEIYSRGFKGLARGGECSKSIIDGTATRLFRKLSLSVYINVDECSLGETMCHEKATCSDVIGAEGSFNCTCNSGYTGDGFSCVEDTSGGDDGHEDATSGSNVGNDSVIVDGGMADGGMADGNEDESTSSESEGVDGGAVAAIVTVLLLLLVAVVTAAVLVVIYFHRRWLKRNQHVTSIGNDLYIKHYEASGDATAAVAYEVPLETLQKEFPYEQGPHSALYSTSELRYEPITDGNNIYDVPDALEESSFNELPAAYAGIYEHAVTGGNIYESAGPYECPAQDVGGLYEQISSYRIKVIDRKEIKFTSHLGSGHFGSVSKAEWRHAGRPVDVALKTLTDSANTVKFLQEAAIMAQFRHPNILTLHGVVSVGDPKMIVVEFMHNGDLKCHVTHMRPDPGQLVADSVPKQLLNFSKQVALGLHYLSCRGFIHRDLAARNVFVSDKLCKIADFGMSRDLADDDIYVSHGGMVPVCWTAPEAISKKIYSTASDVWSYGCLLYEIWSLGHKPFENVQVKQMIQLVKKGYRLPPPPGCPKKIYQLMIDTWHPDVSGRPEPRDVLRALVGNVDEVMAIPGEDVPAGSQAAVLGAPLDTATHLYPQLQNTYM